MARSMADVLREEGREQGREEGREEGRREGEVRSRQDLLLLQLGERFGRVPKVVEQTVRATADVDQLTAWARRFATATRLDEVGIHPRE